VRQAMFGGLFAFAIIVTWLGLHVYSVFFCRFSVVAIAASPVIIVALCWLNVGLFIVAHDAMHGSLFPNAPRCNAAAGSVALALYAAFRFGRLKTSHMAHHRTPGSETDPDFDADHPRRFWPWYMNFMRRYFGIAEFLALSVPVAVYLALGVHIANLLLFWALPASLSSLQLFYFGTYLPHRHGGTAFADRHNARTNEFGWLASFITCFHFGYHHEHHLNPGLPWWQLPAARKARRFARSDPPLA
jgi:beta-carotene ketolase (CrtW type)